MRTTARTLLLGAIISVQGGHTGSAARLAAGPAPQHTSSSEATAMKVYRGLPAKGGNSYYAGNRSPLLPSPLIKLPLGRVEARGWLRHQLDLNAEGFSGHLSEISRFCRFEGNAWTTPGGVGQFGWEEVPYWLKGLVDLGYLTKNPRVQKEAARWLDSVLASQLPNGYFGTRTNLEDSESGTRVLDLWPNMVMLYPLRSFHEATLDARVIPFMTRYFRWQMTLPLDKIYPGSWQKWRAGDNLDSIYWLYNRTGERWLLDLARVNHERTADWAGDIPTWHGVNLAQSFREPAQYYQQTKDLRYLRATERVYDTVVGLYGQFPGGLFAADENARPGFVGPRQGTETCAMVEMMHSHEMLLGITGDRTWADRAEEVAFNSLPASMTPDLKGLHYLTGANMVQLDRTGKGGMFDNDGDMLSYNPYQFRCCQHNVAFGWPYFTERLFMATEGNGLAAALYAPGAVRARVGSGTEVTIEEQTGYPFGEVIDFALSVAAPVRFPLSLRVPRWSERPAIDVNGRPIALPAGEADWITIERGWKDGDRVRLRLPMKVRVRTWEASRGAISVDRGPLTYSLKIGERWERYGESTAWPAFEVFPTTPWNYGLVLNDRDPSSSFLEVESVAAKSPLAPQPFTPESAPLILRAQARRVPQWTQEPNGLVADLQQSPVRSDEPIEDVTLIPMGCARLRITAFPRIGSGADGHTWVEAPPLATASHAWHFMSPIALDDGKVGSSSADTSVPWFMWWDQFGTTEWTQYAFSAPRRVGWTEIYWAEEAAAGSSGRVPSDVRLITPTDGRVRLPAACRVLWWDGKQWREAGRLSGAQIQKDRYNRVTFPAVETTAIRLEVQLQPRLAAGIVEWRIGQ